MSMVEYMPLAKGGSKAAFSQNVSTLMHEDYPQKQALAIAYRVKREGRADGGSSPPWYVRNEARNLAHSGPIPSIVGGRTDHHPMAVKGNSYVFPADHVSSLGQGNTLNGFAVLNKMFGGSGPYGSHAMGIKHGAGPPRASAPRPQKPMFSAGGSDEGGSRGAPGGNVEIMAAGGEDVRTPEAIMGLMRRLYSPREWQNIRRSMEKDPNVPKSATKDDLSMAHHLLDEWILHHREKHIKTLKKLPAPAKK